MQNMKVAALCAVLALGTVACSSGGSDTSGGTTPTETPDDGGEPTVVKVVDSSFDPADVSIAVGDTVVWDWVDTTLPHNVVADDATFSSGSSTADADTEFEFTFTEAGEFTYMCQVHGAAMSGKVTVA